MSADLESFVRYLMSALNVKSLDEVKVYLLGRTVVLAKDREDVMDAFRAISEPAYVPLSKVRELRGRRPSISVRRLDDRAEIVLSDLVSQDQAYLIANALCSRLSNLMPFTVKKVDVIMTFRSSEDGGVFQRFQIVVSLTKVSDDVLEGVLKEVREVVDSLSSTG